LPAARLFSRKKDGICYCVGARLKRLGSKVG
jgi:hypothetical protein